MWNILSGLNETSISLVRFSKNKYQIPRKFFELVQSCFIQTEVWRDRERVRDRHTEMTKQIVAFPNFVNASKNSVPTLESTNSVSITNSNQLVLFRKIIEKIQLNIYKLIYLLH